MMKPQAHGMTAPSENPPDSTDQIQILESVISQLELIIESSYEAIIVCDHKGVIAKVNKSLERLSGGIKPEELLGKTARILEQEGIIISQSKKTLSSNPLTIKQKIKTGVELLVTSNQVFDENGRTLLFVATIRDMSHLHFLEKELEETKGLNSKYYGELQEMRRCWLAVEDVIIKSPNMVAVMEKVFKVARTEANVLLTGESGVGKEVVAKLLHKVSCRKDAPFIQINCGAIPETLMESELFGYEKGAFTDALRHGKPGYFEIANGGTVLLDEIGDLPLSMQVKLLRVIQEKVIFRIGATNPKVLDVRIVAATNRPLEYMVKKGKFREDLYYRLNVVPIEIPPLRERRPDIVPMACAFLNKYNKKHKLQKKLSPEVCNILECYPWPGNVRELKNIVERLVITCDQTNILPNHISAQLMKVNQVPFGQTAVSGPDNLRVHHANVHLPPGDTCEVESCIGAQATRQYHENSIRRALEEMIRHDNRPSLSLNHIRELVEKNYFELLLEIHKTQRKTAQALGIDHTTLSRKIKKWRIMPELCGGPQEYANPGDQGSEEDAPNDIDGQNPSDNRCNSAYTNLNR